MSAALFMLVLISPLLVWTCLTISLLPCLNVSPNSPSLVSNPLVSISALTVPPTEPDCSEVAVDWEVVVDSTAGAVLLLIIVVLLFCWLNIASANPCVFNV